MGGAAQAGRATTRGGRSPRTGPPARPVPIGAPGATALRRALFHDLDDAACRGLDEDGALVHHGIAVAAHLVLRRHVVVTHAALGQNRADAHRLLVAVGLDVLVFDVGAEARPLVDPEDPPDGADSGDSTARTSGSASSARA